jgi:hypothetical protein
MHRSTFAVLTAVAAGLAVCVAHAQPLVPTRPLQPMSRQETVLVHMQKQYNRQDEETYPLAATLDPEGWFCVDLKPYCNINLFSADGKTCPVRFDRMTLGRRVFYGVPFEVIGPDANENRTALALPSTRLLPNELPASVDVAVGRKAAVLYFLVASYYTVKEGEQFVQLNYEDGSLLRWRIVATVDTGDWYHAHTRVYNETTRYVLIPRSETDKTLFRNMHVIERRNEHPGKTIRSITCKTDPAAPMAILLVAVTGHAGE